MTLFVISNSDGMARSMKMLHFLMSMVIVMGTKSVNTDPVGQQLEIFKKTHPETIGVMTTSAGAPIEVKDATNTLNANLIYNEYFMDSITHLNRERIQERPVHAKGAGAYGYFEVTHDVTDICKARLFSRIGKKTPIVVRFSLFAQERGGSDVAQESRGFAVKFYTEEGNLDIVGLNSPMFSIKDPIWFTALTRVQKRNPATNIMDGNMLWDFITLRPETLYNFLLQFSDQGIPDGYRFMPGFSIHTFEVVNKQGIKYFVRFHFVPDMGTKTLTTEQARKIQGVDPDYATRDLYRAIASGEFPSWTVAVQVLTLEDVKSAKIDVFDVSIVLPIDVYPLRPLGRFILNKNPLNSYAEIEQLAFNPSNLVPGILGSPDKLFEARRFAYRDSVNYRLGVNYNKIAVNCPFRAKVNPYNRDGRAPVKDNQKDIPNYFTNSFNGPMPYVDENRGELIKIYQSDANNFKQASQFYTNELTKEERSRLIDNIVYSLGGVAEALQDRAIKLFTVIHPDLGSRIAVAIGTNRTLIKRI